jgi:cytoskeletal protein RodZ
MITARYSLIGLFAIVVIIFVWIIFTRVYTQLNEEKTPELQEFELAQNELSRQVPRDNDASYTIPTYIPSESQKNSGGKIEFNENMDNDALYSTPVEVPEQKPVVTTPAPVQAKISQPKPAVSPLQPQPRQPEAPVYVPQYQQPQYQQQYQPQYQSPEYRQPQVDTPSDEGDYPAYYYY